MANIVTIDLDRNVYDQIIEKCKELGEKLNPICREAGVDRSVLTYWKNGDPNVSSFMTLGKVLKVLQEKENKKNLAQIEPQTAIEPQPEMIQDGIIQNEPQMIQTESDEPENWL